MSQPKRPRVDNCYCQLLFFSRLLTRCGSAARFPDLRHPRRNQYVPIKSIGTKLDDGAVGFVSGERLLVLRLEGTIDFSLGIA